MTVFQGETVTWDNKGGFHNVKFDDGSFQELWADLDQALAKA